MENGKRMIKMEKSYIWSLPTRVFHFLFAAFILFAFLTDEYKNINLWLEFSKAIKGKSQLFWSRGLKKKCGINEISDAQ